MVLLFTDRGQQTARVFVDIKHPVTVRGSEQGSPNLGRKGSPLQAKMLEEKCNKFLKQSTCIEKMHIPSSKVKDEIAKQINQEVQKRLSIRKKSP